MEEEYVDAQDSGMNEAVNRGSDGNDNIGDGSKDFGDMNYDDSYEDDDGGNGFRGGRGRGNFRGRGRGPPPGWMNGPPPMRFRGRGYGPGGPPMRGRGFFRGRPRFNNNYDNNWGPMPPPMMGGPFGPPPHGMMGPGPMGPPPNMMGQPPFGPPPNMPPPNMPAPELWVETKSEEGKSYYYHARTRETTWTRPQESPTCKVITQAEMEAMAAAGQMPPGGLANPAGMGMSGPLGGMGGVGGMGGMGGVAPGMMQPPGALPPFMTQPPPWLKDGGKPENRNAPEARSPSETDDSPPGERSPALQPPNGNMNFPPSSGFPPGAGAPPPQGFPNNPPPGFNNPPGFAGVPGGPGVPGVPGVGGGPVPGGPGPGGPGPGGPGPGPGGLSGAWGGWGGWPPPLVAQPPPNLATANVPNSGAATGAPGAAEPADLPPAAQPPPKKEETVIPPGLAAAAAEWSAHRAPDGRPYYYNAGKGESVWEKPKPMKELEGDPRGAGGGGRGVERAPGAGRAALLLQRRQGRERVGEAQAHEGAGRYVVQVIPAALAAAAAEWSAHRAPDGRPYYYNAGKGESVWEKPKPMKELEGDPRGAGGGGRGVERAPGAGRAALLLQRRQGRERVGEAQAHEGAGRYVVQVIPAALAAAAAEWSAHRAPDGRPYYYNAGKGESVWEKPKPMKELEGDPRGAGGGGRGVERAPGAGRAALLLQRRQGRERVGEAQAHEGAGRYVVQVIPAALAAAAAEWSAHRAPDGRPYYYNAGKGESVIPAALAAAAAEWSAHRAPDGRPYYYNAGKGESVWEKPKPMKELEGDPRGAGGGGRGVERAPGAGRAALLLQRRQGRERVGEAQAHEGAGRYVVQVIPAALAAAAAEWSAHRAPDGRPYYYNAGKGESVWEKPKPMKELEGDPRGAGGGGRGVERAPGAGRAALLLQRRQGRERVGEAQAHEGAGRYVVQVIPAALVAAAAEWSAHRAPDGRPYYYNAGKGESVWEKPKPMKELEELQAKIAEEKGEKPEKDKMDIDGKVEVLPVIDVEAHAEAVAAAEAERVRLQQERETADREAAEREAAEQEKKEKEEKEKEKAKRKNKPISIMPISGTPWCLVWSGDGRVFFYNPTAHTSFWERPEQLVGRADVDRAMACPPAAVTQVLHTTPGVARVQPDTHVLGPEQLVGRADVDRAMACPPAAVTQVLHTTPGVGRAQPDTHVLGPEQLVGRADVDRAMACPPAAVTQVLHTTPGVARVQPDTHVLGPEQLVGRADVDRAMACPPAAVTQVLHTTPGVARVQPDTHVLGPEQLVGRADVDRAMACPPAAVTQVLHTTPGVARVQPDTHVLGPEQLVGRADVDRAMACPPAAVTQVLHTTPGVARVQPDTHVLGPEQLVGRADVDRAMACPPAAVTQVLHTTPGVGRVQPDTHVLGPEQLVGRADVDRAMACPPAAVTQVLHTTPGVARVQPDTHVLGPEQLVGRADVDRAMACPPAAVTQVLHTTPGVARVQPDTHVLGPEQLVGRADVDRAMACPPAAVTQYFQRKEASTTPTAAKPANGELKRSADSSSDDSDAEPAKKAKPEEAATKKTVSTTSSSLIDAGKEARIEAEARAARQRALVPLDQRIRVFRQMLQERDVSAFSTWEKELKKIVCDCRYLLLTSEERKQVYNKYVRERAEEERKEKKNKLQQKKNAFKQLMEEAKLHSKSSFNDFSSKHGRDERFKGIDKPRDRLSYFTEHVADLRKRDKDDKERKRDQAKTDFIALLKEKSVDRHARWADAKKKVDGEARYKAVESSTLREDYFREYCKIVKEERKKDKDQKEKERDRSSSKKEKKDKERDKDKDKEKDKEEKRDKDGKKEKKKEKGSEPEAATGSEAEADADAEADAGAGSDAESEAARERAARAQASIKEREREVQRALATSLRDRDKEREYHKRDEAVQHFNALLADLVRNPDLAWREAKKQLKKDHRYTAAELLTKEDKERLFASHTSTLATRRRDKLRALLTELGVAPTAHWRDVRARLRAEPTAPVYTSADKVTHTSTLAARQAARAAHGAGRGAHRALARRARAPARRAHRARLHQRGQGNTH
ncbi:uncharacterized protein LOC134803087 [Cydia splendana]|uniref:uncharacterized protein LOC134803087 n=1 Tax=Cydia splendana TaxID=1100963 RepID=UPI00300C9E27